MKNIIYEVTVDKDGNREWHMNGMLHREDGPAIEDADGTSVWYRHGKLHRASGPAIEGPNIRHEWWIDGVQLPEPYALLNLFARADETEIDGVKYKLVKM